MPTGLFSQKIAVDDKKTILAIASGGGHWTELTKIIEPLGKEYRFVGVSTKKTPDPKGLYTNSYSVRDFSRKTWWRLPGVLFKVMRIVQREKPFAIISTGAAPGLIGVLIGKIYGKKTLWIDSLANPENLSGSGKIALRMGVRTITQWEKIAGKYKNVIYGGNCFQNRR